MISDPELDRWSDLWRSNEAPAKAADIGARAQKAVRRFWLWIALEVLVTIVMGGGATIWAMRANQSPVRFFGVWIWLSLATAWIFRLINDWNDFTGGAVAIDSYITTLLRRLRSKLRSAEIGGGLFFVQLAFVSTWVFNALNRQGHITLRDYLLLPSNLVLALGALVFVVWLVRYRRRLHHEIAELEKMQLQSDADDNEPWVTSLPTPSVIAQLTTIFEYVQEDILEKLGRQRKKRIW